MELLTPEIGIVFWSLISFLLLFFLLRKYAWKPILKAVLDREKYIDEALDEAQKSKEELKAIQSRGQAIIKEAFEQKEALLKDAQDVREKLFKEVKDKAKQEAQKVKDQLKVDLENEKLKALQEMKAMLLDYSIDIASKVIKRELKDIKDQEHFIRLEMKNLKMN